MACFVQRRAVCEDGSMTSKERFLTLLDGGYILSPSDHFFDAEIACLEAYANEARLCTY